MRNYRFYKLPNNMEVAYQSRAEVEHFYEDIFEKQIYLQHGVSLKDGDCVFDVGANIGFFTIFAHQRCQCITVYAFEPAPPLFEILQFNTSRYGVNAKLFNYGVSNETRRAGFTFYPHSSGMSSFYADQQEEKDALRKIMINQLRKGFPGMGQVMKHVEDILDERFKNEQFDCQLTRLSDIINEHCVEKIDLLKIDVQKSELDVLRGIDENDWKKIEQIVIEVHDINGRMDQIMSLLKWHDYHVVVEQDDLYEGSILYNLFARKHSSLIHSDDRYIEQHELKRASPQQISDRVKRQKEAQVRHKQLIEKRGKDS